MNIMYVAPRYHTNQVPIVKGWIEQGDRVMFLCQYSMKSEDYALLQPVILGYSKIFSMVLGIYRKIFKNKLEKAQVPMSFNVMFGLPPMVKIKRIIREFQPDIVIFRDRSVYNAVIYQYCRRKGIKGILYNQTPYYEANIEKKDIFHRVIRGTTPYIRMTPVLGHEGSDTAVKNGTYYVPFVIEPYLRDAEERRYFRDGGINIVCVGKYEKRKHHIELVNVISQLKEKSEIRLTFIGECSRQLHEKYLEQLRERIKQNHLEDKTRILTNLSLNEVYGEYLNSDLFILPSTGEFASISQLEAMSCALPVVCSDTNGTADCVKEGRNGFLFRDKDFEDLRSKMECILQDRRKLTAMGKESYRIVQEEYNFKRYRESILTMMEEAGKR